MTERRGRNVGEIETSFLSIADFNPVSITKLDFIRQNVLLSYVFYGSIPGLNTYLKIKLALRRNLAVVTVGPLA